ncbi:hypothetical protein H6F77_12915 [Microcoleus sp. FACHB-831]|uniref:hypothetical protein n=1 Tax=Microcoleus sp. FACHB-831 TaxID=2692827 RepID=UPI001686AEB2|nr:hypothetical protein [Microcoleus sp. FACHB-831]MBD1921985.1 hypothetical protein [Microcoleus sp. FACHB-831]
MRFPSLAVCTLTALVAGGLTAGATETPSFEGSPQETYKNNLSVASANVTDSTSAAIAAPEMVQELSSDRLAQAQPALVAQNAPAQAAPEAIAQPNIKALPADNAIAELSTNAAKQPALDISANKNSELFSPNIAKAEADGKTEPGAYITKADALRPDESAAASSKSQASQTVADATPVAATPCTSQKVTNPQSASFQLAQAETTGTNNCPRPQRITPLTLPQVVDEFGASPALSIAIPVGFGADNNTIFAGGEYQASVREDDGSVGSAGIGIGLGDAAKAVGLELSYALDTDDRFEDGGFNAKLHRRFAGDLGVALGWNGFANTGRNDFEHSKYGVITKVFRTRPSINEALSRVAVTVGVGDGQFRSNGAVRRGENNINAFGNVALRIVRPVSFIAEWTGQDLGLGLSIAPFKNFPFVITPAVRDVAGAGDGARFVLGVGTALRF